MRLGDWAYGFIYHLRNSDDKDTVVEEFKQLLDVIRENGFIDFFKDKSIPDRNKTEVLLNLSDDVDYRALSLVCVLVNESLLSRTEKFSLELDRCLAEENGYRSVDVTVSRTPDKETEDRILKIIRGMTEDNVKLYYRIDRSIVGGFIIEFDNKMVDMSIKTRLSRLKQEVVKRKTYESPEVLMGSHNKRHLYSYVEDRLIGFEDMILERRGLKVIKVVLARPINMDLQSILQQKIGKLFNRDVFIRYYTDPSIVGGMILQVRNNRMMDGSAKAKIDALRNHLRKEVLQVD